MKHNVSWDSALWDCHVSFAFLARLALMLHRQQQPPTKTGYMVEQWKMREMRSAKLFGMGDNGLKR